jgi:uncharacterized delta-60 repeat protein
MKKLLTAIAFFCLFQTTQAQYQQGLDHSFAAKGIATIGAPTIAYPQEFTDGALQPDGKIIAVAGANVTRWNSDGSIDKSFAKSGIFNEHISDDNGIPLVSNRYGFNSVALQVDGKIILSGNAEASYPGNPILLLARLLPNGALDSTFGKHGVVCNNTFGRLFWKAATLQPDDKIVVYASIQGSPDTQVIVRYLPNGTIDSSFGIIGKVVNKLVPVGSASDIALMSDGRLVTMYDYFGIARYMPDGNLDTSFNHTGMVSMFSGISSPYPQAIALRPDGKIWIAGHDGFTASAAAYILARFNVDGSIDSSFNGTGYQEYAWDTGAENKCHDILLQPDGKVILGGWVMNKTLKVYTFAQIRIKPDGTEDSSFGDNGRLITSMFDPSIDYGASLDKLLLQPDGKIVALGGSGNSTLPKYTSLATITRYNADGITALKELPPSITSISVYPNPANGLLYIHNNSGQKIAQINIYDIQGKIIKQDPQIVNNTIELSDLPNATYLMSISTVNAQHYQQMVTIIH